MSMHQHINHSEQTPLRLPRGILMLLGLLAIGGVLLLAGHRAHVLDALPWLLILACPLMHVFMHGGHGGHGNYNQPENGRSS